MVVLVFVVALCLAVVSSSRIARDCVFLLLQSLILVGMLITSRRFIDQWIAISLLFAASVLKNLGVARHKMTLELWSCVCFGILGCALNVERTVRMVRHSGLHEEQYQGAAYWLKENTPSGQLVYNSSWDDFPFLFFYNSSNAYVNGLDTGYLYAVSPQLATTYDRNMVGLIPRPSRVAAEAFKSTLIFTLKNRVEFVAACTDDTSLRKVYEDSGAIVYHVVTTGLPEDVPVRAADQPLETSVGRPPEMVRAR
jgi:hypothetical protein